MFLVDDHQAEVLELHVRLDQLVRAHDDIDLPGRQPFEGAADFLDERKRESSAMRTGQSAKRSENVWTCCSGSNVVGTSTATCIVP
jgi:hypothetical protein